MYALMVKAEQMPHPNAGYDRRYFVRTRMVTCSGESI